METAESSTQIQELLENAARHLLHKEYSEAIEVYGEALEVSKNQDGKWQPLLLSLRGYTRFLNDELESAIVDLDLSAELDSLNALTLIRRGQAYLKQKKFGQACEDFKQAGFLAPDNIQVPQLLEELDSRITYMKESDEKVKYPLKKKVSEIIFNRQEDDEELFVNFSGVKEIDRGSRSSRKSVLFRYGATVSQYDLPESPEDSEPTVGNLQQKKEYMELIEKQEEEELEPIRLHQELSSKELATYDPFLPVLSNFSSSTSRKSILKNTLASSPSVDILKPVHAKRISVLSVKDIDGKLVRSSHENRSSILSNFSECKDRKIAFGFVVEGNYQLPSSASEPHHPQSVGLGALQRKSSIRTSGSILYRASYHLKFQRKDSAFSNRLKIDGKILHSENTKSKYRDASKSSRSSNPSSERSLSSSHSDYDLEKHEPVVIKLPAKFVRKESILKRVKDAPMTPVLKSKRSVVFCYEPPYDKPN